jgi:hypothetical protein
VVGEDAGREHAGNASADDDCMGAVLALRLFQGCFPFIGSDC